MTRQYIPKEIQNRFHPHATSVLILVIVLFFLAAYLSYLVTAPAWSKSSAAEIAEWHETTALPIGLAGRNTVVHGDRLYVIGGKKADNSSSRAIYSAIIDAEGELGSWSIVGELPRDYYLFTAVVADDALFLIGGWNGSATVNDVWRGEFLRDGAVDRWSAMPPLPVAVDLHDTVLLNGHIYSVGGWDGAKPQQGIYVAAVTATGLSGWQQVGTLPKALYRHAVTGAQGYLYVTGGYDETGNAQTAVLAATVAGTNAIGDWQMPPSLPMLTYYHNVVIHDGRLVALGGRSDNTFYNSVYSAAIGSNGLPGTWRAEPNLPLPLHRFGAVVLSRNGSDTIYVAAGLRGDADYQSAVYHSTVPEPPTATPTPTLTPTPTATPTPTGALTLLLSNSPNTWVGPGDKVTYTIRYQNEGDRPVSNVTVADAIPNGVELVAGSVQGNGAPFTIEGSQSSAVINWEIGEVAANAGGEVAYTVQRPLLPTPVIPLALAITLDAPTTADLDDEITYRFTVENRAPIALNDLVITNTIPLGALYRSGGDGAPTDGIVRWTIDALDAETSTELTYQVRVRGSLVNYDYWATSREGATARGRVIAVTLVDGQRPRLGDGFVLINEGATITWDVGGQSRQSNLTYNPSFELYLPTVQSGQ